MHEYAQLWVFQSRVFITTFLGFEPTTFWILNVGYFSEANQYVGKIFQILCDHDFHGPLHLHASFIYQDLISQLHENMILLMMMPPL